MLEFFILIGQRVDDAAQSFLLEQRGSGHRGSPGLQVEQLPSPVIVMATGSHTDSLG